jgi:hypothetical protein
MAAVNLKRKDTEMTKKEAVKYFRQFILPEVIKQYGRDDKIAIREEWNNWTDALCKEGTITDHQYSTWVHPF